MGSIEPNQIEPQVRLQSAGCYRTCLKFEVPVYDGGGKGSGAGWRRGRDGAGRRDRDAAWGGGRTARRQVAPWVYGGGDPQQGCN